MRSDGGGGCVWRIWNEDGWAVKWSMDFVNFCRSGIDSSESLIGVRVSSSSFSNGMF